jgi:hypothetical protein
VPSFLSRLFSGRPAAPAAPVPAPAPAAATTLGLRVLAHLRGLGWSGLVDELVRATGRTLAGEAVPQRASGGGLEIGAGAALARPVTVAMFAGEAAATLAGVFKVPQPEVAAVAQDILRTDLRRSLGLDDAELMEAHASTLAELFPEGFDGAMVVSPEQLEFAWGLLLGNWAMAEFLRAMKAGDGSPAPSPVLAARFAQVMSGKGELPMPVASELKLLPR